MRKDEKYRRPQTSGFAAMIAGIAVLYPADEQRMRAPAGGYLRGAQGRESRKEYPMNSKIFLANVATTLALMAAAAAIEVFLPLFERGESSKGRAAQISRLPRSRWA